MAGHNKWSKVKHKKAASDSARSKLFGKLGRMIAVEAKRAGGDQTAPSLRAAIEKAREFNMPKDTIERAIKKGADRDQADLETVVYELYGPSGIAFIATALTDNKNRTTQEIKHLVTKLGYALAGPGAVLWAFTYDEGVYVPTSPLPLAVEDQAAFDALYDALDEHEDIQDVFTSALLPDEDTGD